MLFRLCYAPFLIRKVVKKLFEKYDKIMIGVKNGNSDTFVIIDKDGKIVSDKNADKLYLMGLIETQSENGWMNVDYTEISI